MLQCKAHLHAAHAQWRAHLRATDTAIDMTAGNGHDALALAELLPHGHVIALDVQPQAVQATKLRTAPHAAHVRVLEASHAELAALELPKAHLIVYNLGYLPGGDKKLTTHRETTLSSLTQALKLLHSGGALSIMCYPGHDEGLREEEAVVAWARSLGGHAEFHQWWSRPRAPSWLWIRHE